MRYNIEIRVSGAVVYADGRVLQTCDTHKETRGTQTVLLTSQEDVKMFCRATVMVSCSVR